MSNGLVKLIALTGAIGVGLLVVLQLQKSLSTPKFTISDAVDLDPESSSPKLTNLGDASPAAAALGGLDGSLAGAAEPPKSLLDFGDAPPDTPRSAIQRTAALLPKVAESAAEPPAPTAPRLSFKDDTNLEDPFGSDPAPASGEVVAEASGQAGPGLLDPGMTAPARPVPAQKTVEPSSGLRLVKGDASDLADPFGEDPPPARTSPAAGPPRQIPGEFDFGGKPEGATSGPGRVSLSEEDDGEEVMEADPFGSDVPAPRAAQPAAAKSQPAPLKPVPVPDDDVDPFGAESAPSPLRSPASDERKPVPPRLPAIETEPDPFGTEPASAPLRSPMSEERKPAPPRLPAVNSEPDPFGVEELPQSGGPAAPTEPVVETPAAEVPDKDLWPDLGLPESVPPARSLDFGEEPETEPSSLPPSIPNLPVLRRAPAPSSDPLFEDDAPSMQRGERAQQEIDIPRTPPALPERDLSVEESAEERREPLRLTGERELSPASESDGNGTAREGVPRGEQQPRLTIRKIAPPQATLGQPLIYEVLVKNIGDVSAHQVVVEDRIPRGSRLTGTIPRAEMLENRLFWRLGTVEPGSERKISIRVIPEQEGPIGSVAKVNFVAEIAAEIVITAPQLSLKVECPSQVRTGEAVDMKFVIRNAGNGEAKNVVLRDILPANLQHPAGTDLENAIGDLKPGETRELTLQLTAGESGSVENQAVVTADGGLKVEDNTQLEIVGEQLTLTRKGQTKVYVGRAAVYTNNIKNEGSQPVRQTMVVEDIPAGFDFVEASEGGRYDSQTRTVTWTLGEMQPGETRMISAKYSARTAGEYSSRIQLTGASGSIANIQGRVSVAGMPALSIDSPGEGRVVAVGERLISKILVQNRGTAQAENVELIVNLPAELKLVDAKGPSPFRRDGRAVIFEAVPVVGARTKATYELTLEAVSEGDSRLELEIAADHLTKPVHREEVVQVVTGEAQPLR